MPQLDFISLFPILLGGMLLFWGRKVFWLFVGAVAFVVVMTTAPRLIHHQESLIFYIAVAVGVIAAVAGFFLQKVAVRIAGFVAGGYLLFSVWEKFAPLSTLPWWLPFLVGGILGAVLLSFLFEWALIVLSSLTGAYLIVHNLNLDSNVFVGAFVVLALIGIVVQSRAKRKKGQE
ncbi:MAG: hypothetical protein HY961_08365 [Ignavibacteriae bacterium]|nr:hypothetical protein [Ignavibacteriota bacterium]